MSEGGIGIGVLTKREDWRNRVISGFIRWIDEDWISQEVSIQG